MTPQRRSTPCSTCRRANTAAISGPSTASSGAAACSSTVTWAPAARAAAATSSPIQPAPMTTTRDAGAQGGAEPVAVVERAQGDGACEPRTLDPVVSSSFV